MHSLRRARALAVALAEAASSPYQSSRLYSAGASKRQAPASKSGVATATGRSRTASKPSKEAGAESWSTSASPTETPYQKTKLAVEPSGVAEGVSWPRPSEIPFQAKVANSVNLIGHIHMPVQFQATPDGKFWAGTVIAQDQPSDSPSLWIPIIFEGDLAHIAASHLKKNDHVCIEGQLSADFPAFSASSGQPNVQVMVRSINFVEGSSQVKLTTASRKYEKPVTAKQDVKKKIEDSWRDLLHNPEEWSDHRKAKHDGSVSQKFPDFKRKDRTASLWLNTAPSWILSSIEGIEFGGSDKPRPTKENKGNEDWKDVVENPSKWWDNRADKKKNTYPDFKHKETGQALWLDSAPSWVMSKLPPSKPSEEGAASSWRNAASRPSVKA